MGGGGLVWYLIGAALVVIPFWRILPRYNIPEWVALVAVIPIGAIVLLWIIAFREDPGAKGGRG